MTILMKPKKHILWQPSFPGFAKQSKLGQKVKNLVNTGDEAQKMRGTATGKKKPGYYWENF